MKYKFKCPKCDNKQEIIMPISQYNGKGHICEKCGEELKRDVSDFCSNYDTTNISGFYGKDS